MNRIPVKTRFNKKELEVISNLEVIFESAIFLSPKFRLFNLAILVEYPPIDLSKLIKKVYGITFSEWMIIYRLNCLDNGVKMELNKNNKIKFKEIIKLAGFNSRSTFYFSFKKIRNAKPKEYYNL